MSQTKQPDVHPRGMVPRRPDFDPQAGPLLWSKLPEFAMAYNGYSVVIPYVEYYLNKIMNRVRAECCDDKPELKAALGTFVQQEINHAQYHVRYNKRMFDTIAELRPLIDKLVDELRVQRETRSLAFNAAYCAGFESIATFDSIYLHEECDEYFRDADPHGANLLLWHVAEEFEHRTICHDAFDAVSGNYFTRIFGLVYAFWHIGGTFLQAEDVVARHYRMDMSAAERKASERLSRSLFWRQLRYVAPRMLRIFLPWYNPAQVKVPRRIQAALDFYRRSGPITRHADEAWAKAA